MASSFFNLNSSEVILTCSARTSECKDHLESMYLGEFIPDLHRNQKRTGNYFNRSIPFLRVPFGAFAGLIGSMCVLVFAGGFLFEHPDHAGVKVASAYGAVSVQTRRMDV